MSGRGLFGFFPNIRPDRIGGVEASGRLAWSALLDVMRQRGEPATLFCYEWDEIANEREGFPRIVAKSKGGAIWRALRVREKPRVILVWHLGMLKLVPFLRAPDARVIVFLHGIEAWRAQDGMTKHAFGQVDLFLSNTLFTYHRFLEFQPQLEKIPHSVTALGIGEADPVIALPLSPPALLMLSRLDRGENYKGHQELIGVWDRVRSKLPGAELWIAGDGNLRVDLERLAKGQQSAASIRFLGRVTEDQKQKLLHDCRALAMPSRGEGFGLVYLEAMRAGRPSLVSEADAGRQVVNPPELGLAVNPADADGLVVAVARLLDSGPEWQAWAERTRTRYAEFYTGAHFQSRLVSHF